MKVIVVQSLLDVLTFRPRDRGKTECVRTLEKLKQKVNFLYL